MSKTTPLVQFNFLASCTLPERGKLKSYIGLVFKREGRVLDNLNIIFCDDPYLLSLNRQFLKHDYYTDILSFPLSPPGKPLVGEIYISIDRVRDNARNLETSFNQELHRVIFHGILHFCGYKDKTLRDIRKIRAREDKYLTLYLTLKV